MIRLQKYITKSIYRVDKNAVLRCYGQDDITIDNTNKSHIISRRPFIVEQDGRRFLFTSNPNTVIPEECDYALLINHQINSSTFERAEFQMKGWLKHPAISDDCTPDEIVKSWRGQLTYLHEEHATDQTG